MIGLISTMNDALKVVNNFNRQQLQGLYYDLTYYGWYTDDKRKLRSFAQNVIVSNWHDPFSKSEILCAIYNNAK